MQAINRRVVVLRCRVVVAPVSQRGGAAVELVERADQRGDMQVLRFKHRGQASMHLLEIFQQRPVGSQAAQGSLPGVHVGIDEARNDDETACINDLRIVCPNTVRYVGQRVACYQHVALRQITLHIHRDDGCAF